MLKVATVKYPCAKIITISMSIALMASHHKLHFTTVNKNQSDIQIVNLVSPSFLKTMAMTKLPIYDVVRHHHHILHKSL